jgi:peptidoglycan/LPS O-acetylase OafA/YrhL
MLIVSEEHEASNGEENTIHKLSYRAELDGLRAIAVLAVIFYHAGFKFCPGEFVGVDVFFFLSGYLMTSIVLKEFQQGKFDLFKFYERRIRRIVPMLFLTISLCYFPAQKYMVDKEFFYFTKSVFSSFDWYVKHFIRSFNKGLL